MLALVLALCSQVTPHAASGSPPPTIIDPNQGGQAGSLRIEEVRFGRLVDVYSLEPGTVGRRLFVRDYLIAQTIASDGSDYDLHEQLATGRQTLTILHPAGSAAFQAAFSNLEVDLGFVAENGLSQSFPTIFSLVPRNAVLSVRFSDLLDETSISAQTIRVLTGVPPTQSFDALVVADRNHGGIKTVGGVPTFFPTRVLVKPVVTEADALGGTSPVNLLGLPPSTTNDDANVVLRFPTVLDASVGQFALLRNLAGNTLSPTNNGPIDGNSTHDVLRAFRSGRSDDEPSNQDPNNGFLLDLDPPHLVSIQSVVLVRPPRLLVRGRYDVLFDFEIDQCRQVPQPRDMLVLHGATLPELFAEVISLGAISAEGVVQVRVRFATELLAPGDLATAELEFLQAETGFFHGVFGAGASVLPECLVGVSPLPLNPPNGGLDTSPRFHVHFDEAIDPASVSAFDALRLERSDGSDGIHDLVISSLTPAPDLTEFRLTPILPLAHVPGQSEDYVLRIDAGPSGMTDLAGNALAHGTLALGYDVDPALAVTTATGGLSLTFDALDEDGNGTPAQPLPEVRGQFSYDLQRERILPRAVARSSHVVDRSVGLIDIMNPWPSALQTPLSPLGSRMMTVWRYADVGLQVLDEASANVDVEGLAWAPFGGAVSADFFAQFEIALSHSSRLPDEFPISISLSGGGYAQYPGSGLESTFDANVLADPVNVKKVVHPRDRGYLLLPSHVFTAATGTPMMPYPLNRGVAADQFEYYTWRDTAVLGAGGHQGFGADIRALAFTGATCDAPFPTVYEPGNVRSLALPLLMEFKCFPDTGALGLNGLDTVFALATEAKPIFRAFSSGGFNKSGVPINKNPDGEAKATGGFGPLGAATPGSDNTVMLGQLDLVVRVSRAHTIWLDSGASGGALADYFDPLVEPRADEQPSGTSLVLAFRGADSVTGAHSADAAQYDAYGDPLVTRTVHAIHCDGIPESLEVETADIQVQPFQNDDTWHASIHDLDGAKFLQVRVTFVANAATGEVPTLSSLGIPVSLD